jgi:hypothetical protein
LYTNSGALLVIDFSEWGPSAVTAVWRSGYLAVVDQIRLVGDSGRCAGLHARQLLLHPLLELLLQPPLSKYPLVEMKPMLLRPNDHPGPHKAHVGNDFISREPITIY